MATDTTDMTQEELIRFVHVDNGDEATNAMAYKESAEEALLIAGVYKNYSNPLYKRLIVAFVARSITSPDIPFSFAQSEILSSYIIQLRNLQEMSSK